MSEVDFPTSHQVPNYEDTAQPRRTFPQGALTSMVVASTSALIFQCGTTAAATLITSSTSEPGIWCRTVGYILYGVMAVAVMFLTILSTISARISQTRVERSTTVRGVAAFTASALRRISFVLAFANAALLILCSVLPNSGVLSTCYCSAARIDRGMDSYIIVAVWELPPRGEIPRIVATVLSVACMASYMIFLWITSASPKETEYL